MASWRDNVSKKIPLPVFSYDDPDQSDERLVITMNGVVIADVNHDDEGWAGMTAVQKAVEAIEKQLKKLAK